MFKNLLIGNIIFWVCLSLYLDKQVKDNYPSKHNIRQLAVNSFIRGCLLQRADFLRCRELAQTHEKELIIIMGKD